MQTSAIIAAFSVGLLGSFHCVGMCGAIAFSLPLKEQNWLTRLWGGVLYNLGRISTYGFIGAFFGLLGQGFSLAGFQRAVSIFLGVALLFALLFPKLIQRQKEKSNRFAAFQFWLRSRMGLLFKTQSNFALIGIGMLNGLLPCGLVYVAVAGALATANIWTGVAYMLFFGLGTIPMMLLASQFRGFISLRIRNNIRKALPFFVAIMAILFILRGLNLGIPYVSPILQDRITSWMMPANCH